MGFRPGPVKHLRDLAFLSLAVPHLLDGVAAALPASICLELAVSWLPLHSPIWTDRLTLSLSPRIPIKQYRSPIVENITSCQLARKRECRVGQ